MKNPHVICNANHGGMFQCLHCGQNYTPVLPVSVNVWSAMAGAFSKEHEGCELGPRGRACVYCLQFGHQPDACQAKAR